MQVNCPRCGEQVWDTATVDQRLNKCWGCGLRFDSEEEEEHV
jgi:transcription elongation factor Elf1